MITKIEEAKKKRDQYNAKLKMLESRYNERKKKEDTRRKILIGAYVLDALDKTGSIPAFDQEGLLKELDHFLVRRTDRALFALKGVLVQNPSKEKKE